MRLLLLALVLAAVWWSRQPGSALGASSTYTVRAGDSLSEIAAAHHTTVQELVALNVGRYPSLSASPGLIEPGWVLVLPEGAGGEGTLWDQVATWVKTEAAPALASLAPTPLPPSGGAAVSPSSGGIVVGDEAAENAILGMINQERARLGLEPLVMDEGLRARARERSQDMLARGYCSHNDPETGAYLGVDTWEVIACAGGMIAQGLSFAWPGWQQSPPHYAILTDGNLHRIGIGIARQGSQVIATGQLLP